MSVTDDAIIDAIIRDFPAHQAGTRPVHSRGIALTGWFQASEVAAAYSAAEHFAGRRVPVTVRFSNGPGDMDEPDSSPLVRGMAVKFHLGEPVEDDEGVLVSPAETDLIAITLPAFYVRTLDRFIELTAAAVPVPVEAVPRWRTLFGALKLQSPVPHPRPGALGVLDFANRYPPARIAVVAEGMLRVPESYARCCYRAIHAFRLTTGTCTTAVRFSWEPVAGLRPAPPGVAGNFLAEELRRRVHGGPVEFVLRAHVAEQGDDTADPSRPWPQSRRRLMLGHLQLDTVVADQDRGGERLSFDATRLVPGVEVSDDEVLAVRRSVYGRSVQRRLTERDRRQEASGSSTARHASAAPRRRPGPGARDAVRD